MHDLRCLIALRATLCGESERSVPRGAGSIVNAALMGVSIVSRANRRQHIGPRLSVVKGKCRILYSAAYAMTGPARFTISEVAVDWQEPMVLQRKLRPSNCTR